VRHCDLCLAGGDWMSPVACPKCKREVPELGAECPTCDPKGPNGSPEPIPDPIEPRGYCYDAVASVSLAVASVFIWPLAILAVVYGLAALRTFRDQQKRNQRVDRGRWMAVTAVAVSVAIVPLVVYFVVFV